MLVISKQKQTLSDIAIQVYGDLMATPILAYVNNLEITGDLEVNTVIKCPDLIYNRRLQQYLKAKRINPATQVSADLGLDRIFTEEYSNEFI